MPLEGGVRLRCEIRNGDIDAEAFAPLDLAFLLQPGDRARNPRNILIGFRG